MDAATFSLRQHRRAALRAARCAPSVALDAVLFAPFVDPGAALCAPCVFPDAAPCPTAVSQWKALRAWSVRLRSERQHLTPSELQARPRARTRLRIHKEQERFDG
jgi:hypothetical protein